MGWIRPPGPPTPASTERALAYGRALLAAWATVAVYLDPTEPSRFAAFAYTLLVVYAGASLVYAAAIRRRPHRPPSFGLAAHAADIAFAAAVSALTDGPNSPFFVFFIYALLSAAFRWGGRATVATAAAGIVLLLGEAALLAAVVPDQHTLEVNRVLMRVAHLGVLGILLGRMSEGARRATIESSAAARMVAGARGSGGHGAMEAAASELSALFGARAAVVVVRASESGLVRVWAAEGAGGGHLVAVPHEEEGDYLGPLPGDAILLDRRRPGAVRALALDGEGRPIAASAPTPRLGGRPWSVVLAVGFRLGDEWTGRVFVLDPERAHRGADALRFLLRVVSEVAPAIENIYLVSRLRSRAGAIERTRVARELHDGVLQSLIGLEMQVDVLRRRAAQRDGGGEHPLTHIQAHLRHEIITVRELMEEMRPVELSARGLVEHLAAMVDRFRHETGIAAEFVSDVQDLDLPGRTCRELVRVVQEALTNVRRHAGATHVMVRLGASGGDWALVVDDDGKGLPFAGRLDDRELAAQRIGPVVIRERVLALGGRLAVESTPGRGTRLEVLVPQVARA